MKTNYCKPTQHLFQIIDKEYLKDMTTTQMSGDKLIKVIEFCSKCGEVRTVNIK